MVAKDRQLSVSNKGSYASSVGLTDAEYKDFTSLLDESSNVRGEMSVFTRFPKGMAARVTCHNANSTVPFVDMVLYHGNNVVASERFFGAEVWTMDYNGTNFTVAVHQTLPVSLA